MATNSESDSEKNLVIDMDANDDENDDNKYETVRNKKPKHAPAHRNWAVTSMRKKIGHLSQTIQTM